MPIGGVGSRSVFLFHAHGHVHDVLDRRLHVLHAALVLLFGAAPALAVTIAVAVFVTAARIPLFLPAAPTPSVFCDGEGPR